MHAATRCRLGVEHPGRQRHVGNRFATDDVGLDPLRNLLPAGLLPDLERPLIRAKAKTHGQVQIAGVVGNLFEFACRIVKTVAQQTPDKLRLRIARLAQQL